MGYQFEILLLFAVCCKELVGYFYNHHVEKARLKAALKNSNLGALVSPAPHRWGTLLGCFCSILKAESILNSIVTHCNFELVGTAKNKEQKASIRQIVT